MVIPSFVPALHSINAAPAQRNARSRVVSGILQGGGAEWAAPTTPGDKHVSSVGRTWTSDQERERLPEIRDCFASVGSQETTMRRRRRSRPYELRIRLQ